MNIYQPPTPAQEFWALVFLFLVVPLAYSCIRDSINRPLPVLPAMEVKTVESIDNNLVGEMCK